MTTRHPNTTCDQCEAPIYRRPSTLAINAGKFCSRACRNRAHVRTGPRPEVARFGPDNPCWRGGTYIEPGKGYRMVRCPPHRMAMARQNGYVLEHRLVMAEHHGRDLTRSEVVHHHDHDPLNNAVENLKVYASHREHWMQNHAADVHSARDAAASIRSTKA